MADSNKVTFLTFNYDRLVEKLFIIRFSSLFQELFTIDLNKYQIDFVIYKVIHIYGSLGFLPQKEETDNHNKMIFGEKIKTYERIIDTIPNIRLIKDGLNDPSRKAEKTI